MCSCEDNTNGLSLILRHLAMKSGMLNSVLDSLRAVMYSLRKLYQFTVEVRSVWVSIHWHISLTVFVLSLDVDCHARIIAASTL